MKKKLLAFGVAGLLLVLVASLALAETEFSVGGHFRARSYLLTNPDLKEGGPERSYTDQRLILNPVLKLGDLAQVKVRIRALDYIWGDNGVPGLTWPEMIGWDSDKLATKEQGQGEAGTNNFQVDRAWVHIFLGKYGSVQIGRQQTDLFHNFSIAEDDTYPRYHYITPVFSLPKDNNIMFGFLYDKRSEGGRDVNTESSIIEYGPNGTPDIANRDQRVLPDGTTEYYLLPTSDDKDVNEDGKIAKLTAQDSFAWCPWVFFWRPNLTIGYVFFVWNFAGAAENGKSANWIMHDAMINAKIGPVDIKSEFDYLMGDALPWAASKAGDNTKHNFEFFVDAGVPIPSPVVNRASVLVGLFSGTKKPKDGEVYGSIGSNEDWIDDWKIDLILWDQIFNAVYNAWIIRPKIDFVVPNSKFGGFVSACMSFADQQAGYYYEEHEVKLPDYSLTYPEWTWRNPHPVDLTQGTEKGIGTEIDLGINYTLGPRQTIELVLGYFAPGKYFADRDGTIGAALKTHIRF